MTIGGLRAGERNAVFWITLGKQRGERICEVSVEILTPAGLAAASVHLRAVGYLTGSPARRMGFATNVLRIQALSVQ